MTGVSPPLDAVSAPRADVAQPWPPLRRMLGAAGLFGLALFVFAWGLRLAPPGPRTAGWLAGALAFAFALVVGVAAADRRPGARDPRPRYLAAVGVAAALSMAAGWLVVLAFPDPDAETPGFLFVLYTQFEYAVIGVAAVLVHADRRRSQAALARLHAARLARIASSRRAVESQLNVMQARVEPALLFGTLERVRDAVRDDAGRAEALLDVLIDYLRAAMPRGASESSTVAREAELMRAWAALVRAGARPTLRVSVDVRGVASEAAVPPMTLLPLVEQLASPGEGPREEPRTVAVAVAGDAERLRVRVTCNRPPAARDEPALRTIARRLEDVYAGNARLAVDATPAGAQVTLDVPLEIAREPSPSATTGRSSSAGPAST